jgi:DNA-3-methyladenine glycosylase II
MTREHRTPATLTKTSLADAAYTLAKRDKDLASILTAHGPPPMWGRPPGFSTLVKIILEQQVSLASAASMYRRLRSNVAPFRPHRFVELGEPHFRSLGVTRQKTAYCLHLSECIVTGGLKLRDLPKFDDDQVRNALMQVKGIGSWSADIYLLMALRRPDIWPVGDLALVAAITKLKKLKQPPSTDEFLKMAERWRPFRSVAARMLWQYYLARQYHER